MLKDSKLNKILSEKFKSERVEFPVEELWGEINDSINSYKSSINRKQIILCSVLFLSVLGAFYFYLSNKKVLTPPSAISVNKLPTTIGKYKEGSMYKYTQEKIDVQNRNQIVSPNNSTNLNQDLIGESPRFSNTKNNIKQKKNKTYNRLGGLPNHNKAKPYDNNSNSAIRNQEDDQERLSDQTLLNESYKLTSIYEDIGGKQNPLPSLPLMNLMSIPYQRKNDLEMAFSPNYFKSKSSSQIGLSFSSFLSNVNYKNPSIVDSPVFDALKSTSARAGYSVGVFYRHTLKNNIILSGGLEYLKVRERFIGSADLGSSTSLMTVDTAYYRNTVEGREYFPGDVLVNCDSLHYVEHTNSLNNVNLLLGVGYGLNLSSSRIILMMEYGLNLSFNYSGRIINADRRIVNTDQIVELTKSRTTGIAGLKFIVEHPISDQISLGGGFSLRQQLGSGFIDFDNRITMLSGDLSIHYNF